MLSDQFSGRLVGSCDDSPSALDNCGINSQYVITYNEPVNTAGYDIIMQKIAPISFQEKTQIKRG
ncbi:MAG: hypothetical protein CM1200mP10_23970 [Candidatus Neomarinimicrobiota bacterium]|nr:MAG: hypothetical protein CM1200mP10_23970 [Candidatus Neomarinimicrobiota bacterium]